MTAVLYLLGVGLVHIFLQTAVCTCTQELVWCTKVPSHVLPVTAFLGSETPISVYDLVTFCFFSILLKFADKLFDMRMWCWLKSWLWFVTMLWWCGIVATCKDKYWIIFWMYFDWNLCIFQTACMNDGARCSDLWFVACVQIVMDRSCFLTVLCAPLSAMVFNRTDFR
jgi:hypothetical protein